MRLALAQDEELRIRFSQLFAVAKHRSPSVVLPCECERRSCLGMHSDDGRAHGCLPCVPSIQSQSPKLDRYERHSEGEFEGKNLPAVGSRRWPALVAAVVQAAVVCAGFKLTDWVFHNRACGLLFRCGCTWPWAGGWANCNFHNPSGPKCPWCNVRNTNLAWLAPAISSEFTVVAMFVAYAAVWFRQLLQHVEPTVWRLASRVVAAFGTFVGQALVLGWIFFAFSTPEYPCFLWIVDPETRCGGKA